MEKTLFQSSVIPNQSNKKNLENKDDINVNKSEKLHKIDNSILNNNNYNLVNQIEIDKFSVSNSIESLTAKEFIIPYNWKILPEEPRTNEELFVNNVLLVFETDEIFSFKKKIDKLNFSLNNQDNQDFNTIDQINFFENENNKTSEQLIFRKIKGDGNCFDRVVIFSFLEKIIFTNNLILLRNFLVDFKLKLREVFFTSMAEEYNIDLKKAFKSLIMIYFSLTSKSHDPITKTYSVLIKLYNNIEDFDKALIAYFRIALYFYIEENKGKYLSEEVQILIDSLLPDEFKKDNNFDFELFYQNFLFKLYKNDEKIILYLTPFILGFNIEMIYADDISNINLNSKRVLLNGIDSKADKIILLYKKTHYDLIYNEQYFKEYNKYLTVDYLAVKNAIHCILCKSQIKSQMMKFKKNEKDIIYICAKCVMKEIKFNLKNLFIFFIQKQRKYFLSKITESISNFPESEITLGNQVHLTIKLAIDKINKKMHENFNFEGIMKNVKSTICIMCDKPIEHKSKLRAVLPCECCLCSNICLNDYYKFNSSIIILKDNIYCLCGKNYQSSDVIKFIKLLNFYQINAEELLKYYLKKNQDKCYVCFKKNQFFSKCEIYDKELSINSNMEHIICHTCMEKIDSDKNIEKKFLCKFCNSEHKMINIIEKDYNPESNLNYTKNKLFEIEK